MPRTTRSKLLYLALAACLFLGAFGTWVLLHPASVWVQPWRAARSDTSERIIFGPYPVEADFAFLKEKGVTTIVSLLNPDQPYERALLAQERGHAARHGMKVLNFPMGSILGHSFGKDYMANSRAAAEAALNADGAAYIHCYLGLHRAKNVQRYLAGFAKSESYAGSVERERSSDRLALDEANRAHIEGRHQDSLRELARIEVQDADALLLEGSNHMRLGDLGAAAAAYARVLVVDPDHAGATTGLGFVALRRHNTSSAQHDLGEAERRFTRTLAVRQGDLDATEGLAYVRHRQGRGDEARALLQRVIEANPGHTEVRTLLERLGPASSSGAASGSAVNAP
ncbi:tetratricopeptide repeat protein [Aerolutibacter ruishenii]|uniref:Tetratricopeptide repeat protein n=1 Tax=Aerolutibacter ruishenii TaxID=686800 RepID=A0A562M1B9_9GAMM|nr:tetratricopeptide repeat protein [Lysobacter ruishenii]TWI13612.1 tetratricopeptide repeat protein [Lysobacter ruishenii]